MNNIERLREIMMIIELNNISIPNNISEELQNHMDRYKIIHKEVMREFDLKKIELLLDNIIANDEIEDVLDWLVDLGNMNKTGDEIVDLYSMEMSNYGILMTKLLIESRYEICAKVREVVKIITNDCIRLIKIKDIDKEDKERLLDEIDFIYKVYHQSLKKVIE